MRPQIFLYFMTFASLPLRQGWVPLKHPAHPGRHQLPYSSSVFLSFPSLSLLGNPWLLSPGGPRPLRRLPRPLCSERPTSLLASEHRGVQSSAGFCAARPGFGNWPRPLPSLPSAQVPRPACACLSPHSPSVELLPPAPVTTLAPLSAGSEASKRAIVSLGHCLLSTYYWPRAHPNTLHA